MGIRNIKFKHFVLIDVILIEMAEGIAQFPTTKINTANLNSSTLHVFSAHYEPFTYLNEKNILVHGIEYFLLKTIADKLKMRISFTKIKTISFEPMEANFKVDEKYQAFLSFFYSRFFFQGMILQ